MLVGEKEKGGDENGGYRTNLGQRGIEGCHAIAGVHGGSIPEREA